MSENMTYVPSRLTSAKTNKVVAGANEILDDDINLKQDVINTLSKKVIDLNSVPTSSTLTYTVNSVTCDFKVGDEVRVADKESKTGYTFYKLYELTTEESVTTAVWDKLGAGSSINPNETVNISLTQVGGNSSDLIGATVTITDDDTSTTIFTGAWNGSIITTEIDTNTNYTVSVETISGYIACADQSYQAGNQTERNITFQYRAPGAYVEATDGSLYTSSTWASSGKIANAVVVITDACKIRMALTQTSLPIHSNYTDLIENYITAKGKTDAKVDYDGEGNTNKIVQFNVAYGTNTTSYAAPYCKAFNFTFPSGQKGCLPALGQLWTLYQNKTEVDDCLAACGGTAIPSSFTWSSTYWGDIIGGKRCLGLNWADGDIDGPTLSEVYYVRPVSAYE